MRMEDLQIKKKTHDKYFQQKPAFIIHMVGICIMDIWWNLKSFFISSEQKRFCVKFLDLYINRRRGCILNR